MSNKKEITTPKIKSNSFGINLTLVIIIGVFLAVSLFIMNSGAERAFDEYQSSYDETYNNTYSRTYNNYVKAGYNYGYDKYHVKNEVNISIGDVQECAKLEVLQVCDFDYATSSKCDNEQKIDSVFEVTVKGTYCVNMKLSEIIIDNKNQTVTVRVPNPTLTDFSSKNYMLYFYKNGSILDILDKGNYSEGENFTMRQIKECTASIKHNLRYNQQNERNAQESARNTLINIIKNLNPDVPDLKVFVEFDDTILA